jgi:N-acetylglucosamine-6-phosphate deacetylase
MHEAGLPALDAIRTAATSAAKLLGVEGSTGRLANGYQGNAIVVSEGI